MEPIIVLQGIRLPQDPDVRTTSKGTQMASVRLPIQARKKGDGGKWEDTGETLWLPCKAFGTAADALGSCRRGSYVTITARLTVDAPWTSRDGTVRPASLVLMVQDVQAAEREERGGERPKREERPVSRQAPEPGPPGDDSDLPFK